MITEANFRDVLTRLGFTSDTYEIAYENETLSMRVDFTARKLSTNAVIPLASAMGI